MKLYEFEKYYLRLFLFKVLSTVSKILNNKIGLTIVTIIIFFMSYIIAVTMLVYFVLGVNVFLEKVHLEKYRIEKITFMTSEIDLKDFYQKSEL